MTSCHTGKTAYKSRLLALIQLAKIQRQDKPGHNERRVYHCPTCKRWHLTSMTEEEHENSAALSK